MSNSKSASEIPSENRVGVKKIGSGEIMNHPNKYVHTSPNPAVGTGDAAYENPESISSSTGEYNYGLVVQSFF